MEYYKMRMAVIFLLSSLLIISCWNNNSSEEGFYDYSRISYIYRLPLIEPYMITSPDNGVNWAFEFKSKPPPTHGVQFLTGVGINDSVFIVYSPRDLSTPGHPRVWAVVDVSKTEEKVFTDENDYKKYLKQKGINDIKLYNINDVFAEFDKNKKLPPEWATK